MSQSACLSVKQVFSIVTGVKTELMHYTTEKSYELTKYKMKSLAAYFGLFCHNIKWARSCENVSYAICEQQRCRSACASAQSDQHLCCSLLR